jgi:hypothetical protein
VGSLCENEFEIDHFLSSSSSARVEPLRFGEQVSRSGQEVVIVVFQVDLRLGLVEDPDGVDGSNVIRESERNS